MILIGLTGGIGSGKSTVAALLQERGAVIVDGDRIARELQQPGSSAVVEIGEKFPGVVDDAGVLDRSKLAALVFSDAGRLSELNRIMLPRIHGEIERRIEEHRSTDSVVVLDLPLLAENPRSDLDGVIVVDVAEDIAIRRLVELRGMDETDARARIARQASRDDRRKIADQVIDNSFGIDELRIAVENAWEWIIGLTPRSAQ